MFRPFVLTSLMIALLLVASGGCGGKKEVAQAPAAAAPAPSGGGDMGGSMPADVGGTTEPESGPGPGMLGPPSDGAMGSGDTTMAGMDMGAMGPGMSPPDGGFGGTGMEGMMGMGMAPGMGGMQPGFEGGMGMGMGGQFAPPEDPAPDEESDYLTKGRYAFSIGKEKEAIDYARAFAISAANGAEVLDKTKWFSTGMRPVNTIRFAVGVVLEAPASMTDFKPIGSTQTPGGGGGASAPMGSPGGASAAVGKSKEHALYDLTGTFGEAVITGFKERWSSGNYGGVFNDVEKLAPKVLGPDNGMAMGSGSGMGSGMGMRGGPPAGSDGMSGMEGGMMAPDGGMSGSSNGQAASRERIMPGTIIAPGMVYIGSAEKQADLMQKAVDRGVDVVVLFDVKASGPNRVNGIVQNEARVRVVSIKGDMLGRSGELLNTKVQRALASTNGEDEVAKVTEKFFMQLDDKLKLTDMPTLKPEHATARLIQLLSSTTYSKLEKLYEISLYHSKNLISDDDKLKACLIVMEGSEGESLATGRPEDKQAVLDPLLPNYR